jgi:Na+/H+-dicarboxylate symporter
LQLIADIYIRLMQMTVLPYLVLSLIAGIGELDATGVKRLAVRCGLLLVVFRVLGKGAEERHRRWSIMYDVLGWGK